MPMIKKRGYVSKKQQPEQEIMTFAHKVSDFLSANKKIIITISAAIAVFLVLSAVSFLIRSNREQKAAPLAASAYEYYRPGQGAAPDYVKALDLFREVNKKYPSTRSGAIAHYYIGNCLANLGRNEEALQEYQAFIAKYSSDKFLSGLVYERMGYLNMALGKQSEAIKAFEHSDTLVGPGVSTAELAKLYEDSGNIIESQKKYKIVMDKLAGTKSAMEAMGKVQKIAPASTPESLKKSK